MAKVYLVEESMTYEYDTIRSVWSSQGAAFNEAKRLAERQLDPLMQNYERALEMYRKRVEQAQAENVILMGWRAREPQKPDLEFIPGDENLLPRFHVGEHTFSILEFELDKTEEEV